MSPPPARARVWTQDSGSHPAGLCPLRSAANDAVRRHTQRACTLQRSAPVGCVVGTHVAGAPAAGNAARKWNILTNDQASYACAQEEERVRVRIRNDSRLHRNTHWAQQQCRKHRPEESCCAGCDEHTPPPRSLAGTSQRRTCGPSRFSPGAFRHGDRRACGSPPPCAERHSKPASEHTLAQTSQFTSCAHPVCLSSRRRVRHSAPVAWR